MAPRLQPGDHVLVDVRAYRQSLPRRGDIVVARHPYRRNMRVVKRVSAVLDNGACLLEGDNASESTDSRAFGPLQPQQILGRVTSRF